MNHNYLKLMEAMNCEPNKWEYRNEVIDYGSAFGKCSCGHDIRWNYPLYHKETGKCISIGSVCIENAPFLPLELVESYKKEIERRKEEARRSEELRRQVLRGELETNFVKNKEVFYSFYKNQHSYLQRRFPEGYTYGTQDYFNRSIFTGLMYQIIKKLKQIPKKRLKTDAGWIKTYQTVTKAMQDFNEKNNLGMVLFL